MKIVLISMPFARLEFPSLALTQLSAGLKMRLPQTYDIQTIYLNHDFLEIMDYETYKILTGNSVYIKNPNDIIKIVEPETMKKSLKRKKLYSGAGEWLFRQLAHPESHDNADEYLKSYFTRKCEAEDLLLIRAKLEQFLKKLIQRHRLAEYDMVCFTSMFQQINPSLAMANLIKKENPSIITVMGGNNLDFSAFVLAKYNPNIDHYIQNGSYEDLLQLINEYEKNPDKRNVRKCIHGGQMDINTCLQLDYVPFLSSFEKHFKDTGRKPIVFFETSRGCWWGEKSRCKFCDYNKNDFTYRRMKPKKAIQYLQNIIDTCAGHCYLLWAVDSIIPVDYFKNVFPYLKIPLDIKIFYEVRASLTEDQIKELKRSHITMVQAGIEAMDTRTLSILGKGMHATDNIAFIRNCCSYGVSVLWNMLCGIPGENIQRFYDFLELIPNLFHLYPPTGIWGISFDRQSEYVLHSDTYHLNFQPDIEILQYQFPYPKEALKEMAYFYSETDKEKRYIAEKVKVIEKIKCKILAWQNAWKQSEINLLPRLYIDRRPKEKYIVDSRSGIIKETLIDDEIENILTVLQVPKSSDGPEMKEIKDKSNIAFDQCCSNNWIWEESDRIVSLITLNAPLLPVPYNQLDGWYWE